MVGDHFDTVILWIIILIFGVIIYFLCDIPTVYRDIEYNECIKIYIDGEYYPCSELEKRNLQKYRVLRIYR